MVQMDWGDAAGSGDEQLPFLIDETGRAAFPVRGVLRIGRAPENSIVVTDPTVSRLHAELWREGERVMLRSLGANGTRINGQPIPGEHALEDGDRVDIGWSSFNFTQQDLPFGIHSTSRGIASVASSAGLPPAGEEPSASRSTAMINVAALRATGIAGVSHPPGSDSARLIDTPSGRDRLVITWLLGGGLLVGIVIVGILVFLA